ncbi:MAG: type II toxin-antitoxin system VapC family toxin [Coxiellaceae bacterium]|nr:type II toxin-antitoxin system VapC family toxin [Coxiellaceae bacterium]
MKYLLDTNILSETVKAKPNKLVLSWLQKTSDDSLYISVLTLGEIRKGIESAKDPKRKQKLRLWLERELTAWFANHVIHIDADVADRWGRLLAEEKRPLPAIDSLIAATALHFDMTVVTRNESDFQFKTLEVINPWKLN